MKRLFVAAVLLVLTACASPQLAWTKIDKPIDIFGNKETGATYIAGNDISKEVFFRVEIYPSTESKWVLANYSENKLSAVYQGNIKHMCPVPHYANKVADGWTYHFYFYKEGDFSSRVATAHLDREVCKGIPAKT